MHLQVTNGTLLDAVVVLLPEHLQFTRPVQLESARPCMLAIPAKLDQHTQYIGSVGDIIY